MTARTVEQSSGRSGPFRAPQLLLNPQQRCNLMLLFIVTVGLLICGGEEEGSVSAEGSHGTEQGRNYSQKSDSHSGVVRRGCVQSTGMPVRRTGIRSISCSESGLSGRNFCHRTFSSA